MRTNVENAAHGPTGEDPGADCPPTRVLPVVDAADGRTRHYGQFYGLEPLPATGRPRLAVFGNCQAEALRVSIDTAGVVDSVRMPPVHELEPHDLAHLDRVLSWVDVLVAQAVGDGIEAGIAVGDQRELVVGGQRGSQCGREVVLLRQQRLQRGVGLSAEDDLTVGAGNLGSPSGHRLHGIRGASGTVQLLGAELAHGLQHDRERRILTGHVQQLRGALTLLPQRGTPARLSARQQQGAGGALPEPGGEQRRPAHFGGDRRLDLVGGEDEQSPASGRCPHGTRRIGRRVGVGVG